MTFREYLGIRRQLSAIGLSAVLTLGVVLPASAALGVDIVLMDGPLTDAVQDVSGHKQILATLVATSFVGGVVALGFMLRDVLTKIDRRS